MDRNPLFGGSRRLRSVRSGFASPDAAPSMSSTCDHRVCATSSDLRIDTGDQGICVRACKSTIVVHRDGRRSRSWHADVAQLVAHHLAKVRVAGSNPVVRSENLGSTPDLQDLEFGGPGVFRRNGRVA